MRLLPCRVVKGILQWLEAGRLLRKQFPSPPVDSRILGHAPSMAGAAVTAPTLHANDAFALIVGHKAICAPEGPRHHRWLQRMAEQCGKTFYMRLAHNHVRACLGCAPHSILLHASVKAAQAASCCLQVAVIVDPTLMPPIFDRMNYPPNTDTLDRPVDEMLHKMDAVCLHACAPCPPSGV